MIPYVLIILFSLFQVAYSSPVSVASYPFLGVVLLLIGFVLMAVYFIYQMRGAGKRNLFFELIIAAASSGALGFGTLFLMSSFGLFV